MEENEDYPVLLACLPLSPKFAHLKKIIITSGDFTVGRSLSNSVCIPFIAISRKHCTFKKVGENDWYLEDHSTAGVKVNNEKLGQGLVRKLEHEDLITLEPSDEFSYKFTFPSLNVFETPRKRMKMANTPDSTIINNVKLKFEESQKCEIQHIEDKIQNAKQMQTTSMILKKQLQEDMNRKIQQLENEFSVQIENLKGERNEVEKQKATLIEERDAQLTSVKNEMKGKITELMEQIGKHNETETELLQENSLLKEKLMKEREDFLSELNRESSSKQDMLNKLEAKIREQEEVRLAERKELEDTLRRETEQLRLAKEQELKEMAEQKHQREEELEQELNNIKKNFAEQVEQTEQQRIKAEQELKLQMEQMNKLQAEEKAKMDQFLKEKEEIQNKLTEAQIDAAKSQVEVQARVSKRETELAALAAERIQKQVDQSSEVISTLQEQLEKVKSQLQTVETEKNTLLETISMDPPNEGTSKQDTLNEFSELMESELQCSICAELFVEPTTLYCSHTFCKYCITMWKKKKQDCPICRSPITSECKSLVLVSFIEKMVQNLTDEMKTKRQEMLKHRAELNAELAWQNVDETSRGGAEFFETSDNEQLEEEEENYDETYDFYFAAERLRSTDQSSDSDSGSDDAADAPTLDSSASGSITAHSVSAEADREPDALSVPDSGSDDVTYQSDTDRADRRSSDYDTIPEGFTVIYTDRVTDMDWNYFSISIGENATDTESSDPDRESDDAPDSVRHDSSESDGDRSDRQSSDIDSGWAEAADNTEYHQYDANDATLVTPAESDISVERHQSDASMRSADNDGYASHYDRSDSQSSDPDGEFDDESPPFIGSDEVTNQSDIDRPDSNWSANRSSDIDSGWADNGDNYESYRETASQTTPAGLSDGEGESDDAASGTDSGSGTYQPDMYTDGPDIDRNSSDNDEWDSDGSDSNEFDR